MRAVQITRLDGPGAVELVSLPDPSLDEDSVLVDVRAAGVAFPELLQTRGRYQVQPPLPFVPGGEVAGVVVEAPAGSGFAAGDRVCAYGGIGGFAERVAVDADRTFPLPDRLSFVEGAALPLNLLTAHFALTMRGRLAAGETVVVHGAAGGIGTTVIALAKALGAGHVTGVVSSPVKAEVARQAGADSVVATVDFLAAVRERHPDGVDMVVDPVGGELFTDSLRSLQPAGRLLVVGFAAGDIPTVKVNRLLLTNVDVVGVGWGAYALRRPAYLRAQWAELLPHLESGRVTPLVGRVFELAEAAEALQLLDDRRAVGKVVLRTA